MNPSPETDDTREILDLLAEAGQLKRVPRSGWSVASVPDPESVADHVFRTCILGHLLARLEGADPARVVLILLYHDLAEARIGDLHRMAARYLDKATGEQRALDAALGGSGLAIKDEIRGLVEAAREGSREAIVAKDADRLECMIQGREYHDAGHRHAEAWYANREGELETESAKRIARALVSWNPTGWRDTPSESPRPEPRPPERDA